LIHTTRIRSQSNNKKRKEKERTRRSRCFTKQKPHAARRKGRKMLFLSLVTLTCEPLTLTFKLFRAKDQKHIFRVNLMQICSAVPPSRYFIHKRGKKRRTNHSMKIYMVSVLHRATINKNTDWRCQKQNLPQLTAYGKDRDITTYTVIYTVSHKNTHAVFSLCLIQKLTDLTDF